MQRARRVVGLALLPFKFMSLRSKTAGGFRVCMLRYRAWCSGLTPHHAKTARVGGPGARRV